MHSKEIITSLQLKPHPEGGYYKETYRSNQTILNEEGNRRNVSTSIYYLLENDDKSHFHRIKSDEQWFYHLGKSLEIVYIQDDKLASILLGNNLEKGEMLHAVVPANSWFASHVKDEEGFTLVSCMVAPGFDFADFEMAKREDLLHQFPDLQDVIKKFTRE